MFQIRVTPMLKLAILSIFLGLGVPIQAYYTTQGQNVVDRETGEIVLLKGFGLGGWLLPEGYMWGIRKLDRPRQFEAAIEDLIGPGQAKKFWDAYHKNFVTRADVAIMKSWGVNTLRVPLLASMIQPRENQPSNPPFIYDEHNFQFLDDFVDWCEEIGMGVIWDLHGAPGGQNAENISDSDGEARLWTEKDKYWPLTIDLWDTITRRYSGMKCIVGYDLLNEPLLTRYPDVDPDLLRELYVILTEKIRETDQDGIIFIEGDDWAQDFSVLEPMDWDQHLVMAFHSYPPSNSQSGIQRWDQLRQKYDIPLWHGETGEQDPPWEIYKRSTRFLETANIGWNWWTHKKFDLSRQPWSIPRTSGFEKILDYWNGQAKKPSKWQAKRWLFKQALMTNSINCEFLPGMVESLHPLDPSAYIRTRGIQAPVIIKQPEDKIVELGYSAAIRARISGYPLEYQWYRDNTSIDGANSFEVYLNELESSEIPGVYYVTATNSKGTVKSKSVKITTKPFDGITLKLSRDVPIIDGEMDEFWKSATRLNLQNVISGTVTSDSDLKAWASLIYGNEYIYWFVRVFDDSISTNSAVDHMKDGIELYLDADNSKSAFYGNDDFQLRYIIDEAELTSSIGQTITRARVAQLRLSDGYQMEVAIPWNSIDPNGEIHNYLGVDIHVNDNDSNTRNGKLAWWGTRDNAYQSPSRFGTVRLIE
ncbi:MAG: cellulase family glycosylhydrolase [Candidatus Marinimicrobia bacterium]|nr:cellulase family glycosylhydrolase [Candidatus Neomarinimicrobiota bacterium]